MTADKGRRNRRQLWLLIVLFFAPLTVAFLLYYGSHGWRPAGSTNHGDLVTPPRPLRPVELPTPAGESIPADFLQGKWSVLFVGDGQCDARCREALTLVRQTRIALGDELTRVQRVFVATDNCCDQAYLEQEHAGLITVVADTGPGRDFLRDFPVYEGTSVESAGRIYVADPLGNLMMSYSPAAEPKGLLLDLKKLLKLSRIG